MVGLVKFTNHAASLACEGELTQGFTDRLPKRSQEART